MEEIGSADHLHEPLTKLKQTKEKHEQLITECESTHQHILASIIAKSELQFGTDDGEPIVPNNEDIEEKNHQLKEELFALKSEVEQALATRNLLKEQLEQAKCEKVAFKKKLEAKRAEYQAALSKNQKRTEKVFFKMHNGNPFLSKSKA